MSQDIQSTDCCWDYLSSNRFQNRAKEKICNKKKNRPEDVKHCVYLTMEHSRKDSKATLFHVQLSNLPRFYTLTEPSIVNLFCLASEDLAQMNTR